MKVLIIGGVAGGATAAARLRRLDENTQIIIIEKSGYISYANCGLPYYIGGAIKDKRQLTLQTPQSFFKRFRIDARVNNEALKIDEVKKTVLIKNLVTGEEYEETYDKLILAPGAKPIKPTIEGIDNPKVFTLRTVEDTFKIADFIEKNNPKNAVVIGGGFIGLEMAENLHHRNIKVDLIQNTDYLMPNIDKDMATILQNYLRHNGIKIHLNANTKKIVNEDGKLILEINNEPNLETDMVIMAVGVNPDSNLANNLNIKLGLKNAFVVNDKMQLTEDIYAVGDAVMVKHLVTNNDAIISLAGPANKQGRIAADNILNFKSTYKGSLGSSIMKLFDMTIASTGLNSRLCELNNISYDYVILTSASHATYYPNSKSMYLKVLFSKEDGKILGGQIIGFDGVDKRIDVLATAIKFKAKASDLKDLDLAYAPPYSSAKDPINMAGYAIENILNGLVKQVHWDEVEKIANAFILDVRTSMEYNLGNIANSINIEIDSIRENLNMIPKDKPIIVYCHSGLRSYIACRILTAHGYDCYNVCGGYGFYKNIILNAQMLEEGKRPCGL